MTKRWTHSKWVGLAVATAVVATLWCPASFADRAISTKRTIFELDDGYVRATVGFREMFNAALKRRLRNGFATTVKMELFVYRVGKKRPIAVRTRVLRAVYDLWDEQFLLTVETKGSTRQWKLRSERQVVDRLTSLWRFPITAVGRLSRNAQYFLAGMAEVNPIRREVLTEVRRWLRKPHRRKQSRGGESLFGSFVSIFVNDRVQRAEKVFKFRSQPFHLQK